jgi:hypothetical protein
MSGVRRCCCCSILAFWLGGACSITVQPIKLGSDGGDAANRQCAGYVGVDANRGDSLSQGLVAYYPCEQASGTALPDLSGNNRNATLASTGTGSVVGYRFAAGKVGKALLLSTASDTHVVLPSGLLAGACEATIATWVFLNSQSDWQRIWTFSTNWSVYMFLTPSNSDTGVLRLGITLNGNNADQQFLDGPTALPTGVWKHVAVVLGPAGLVIYVDGAQFAASPSVTLRPADLGATPNNYIGRSNFPWDPYLDGGVDEFRVYNRALSPAEIQALYGGS